MKTFILISLIIFSLIACNSIHQKDKTETESGNPLLNIKDQEQKPIAKAGENLVAIDNKPIFPDDSLTLNGVKGLLVCENVYDTIIIYNSDSSVFTRFTFKGDDSKEFYDKLNQNVKQFKVEYYHPDYSLLIFPCNPQESWFEIYLLDGLPKYIQSSSKIFKFYTWQEYLLSNSYLSIDDDPFITVNNPFRELKDTSSSVINFKRKQNEIYHIESISIQEDWVKVTCEYENGDKSHAWVKWRSENNFLLKFSHIL